MNTRLVRKLLYPCVCAACIMPAGLLRAADPGLAPMAAGEPAKAAPAPTGDVPDLSFGNSHFKATLVDSEEKARKGAATVRVELRDTGTRLTDPDTTTGEPTPNEGHLHFQVDDAPVIATTATKLSFHGLAPGSHLISVTLAGNDHKAISPKQTINVTIPQSTGIGY